MSTRVYEAVKTRIGSAITGGIYAGRAPQGIELPYAVFVPIANVAHHWVNDLEFRRQTFQISVYDKTLELVGNHARTIMEKLDFAPLSISEGNVIECRRTHDRYAIDKKDDELWHAIIEYRVTRSKSVTYSPS
jgi:hypothetical protein